MKKLIVLATLAITFFISGCQTSQKVVLKKVKPVIIAHRGASGHLPEHTLEAYELAIRSYADFIEPDLISTKDGHLIVRHENELSDTTDVAKKFPKRKRTKTIDGEKKTGWFSEDFTLKEIKNLRAKQRLTYRDQSYNGKFLIPTFEEVLEFIKDKKTPTGERIGIYPEIKHGTYFRGLNLAMEEKTVALLAQHGFRSKSDPAIIQSFEKDSLLILRRLTELRLLQLTWEGPLTSENLQQIASYADGIGPNKEQIIPNRNDGTQEAPSNLVALAHQNKLFVHPYTFRSDEQMLPKAYDGDHQKEYFKFFDLGVEGIFSDFPEDAAKARESWLAQPAK